MQNATSCPSSVAVKVDSRLQSTGSQERSWFRTLAARCARVVQPFLALFANRGRREDRVRAAPAVSRAVDTNKSAHEHTGSAETLRPSLRNGFTVYIVLSPVGPSSLSLSLLGRVRHFG